MDENVNNTNTNNVVVTNPVPTPVEPVQQPVQTQTPVVEIQPVQTQQPTPVESVQQPVASPVIAPVEENIEETAPVVDEHQEMLDNNKKLVSSSPQAVDTSAIDVSFEENTVKSESNVVSETVIDTDLNNAVVEEVQASATFEEVSLTLDSNSLDLTEEENDPNSIFNRVETKTDNNTPAKMGEEKHKFPYFMIIIFILLIVAAFNMEVISGFISKYILNEPTEEIEPVKKKEEVPKETENEYILNEPIKVSQLLTKLDESKVISTYAAEKNIEINISYDDVNKKLSFLTSNYLNIEGKDNIDVEYTVEDDSISTEFDDTTKEFNQLIIKAIVLALGDLEGLNKNDYETKVIDTIDNLFNDNYKTHIYSVTSSYSTLSDINNTYKVTISLLYKSILI